MQTITLRNALLQAEVVPAAGGGLASLYWLGRGEREPLLRPLTVDAGESPLPSQLACFPLLPWSNRMAPGGFQFEGETYTPAATRAGEPCPIHGDGWLQQWRVRGGTTGSVTLELDRSGASPFSYQAQLRYTLDQDALIVDLEVRNVGEAALPFGLGLHPWMVDPQGAQLRAGADGVWMAGPDKLPLQREAMPPAWNFNTAQALPRDGVDHVFTGWDGEAEIVWPERKLALHLQADMEYYILYVPPGRDFFCFEPVDHPINAHNLPGYPGLTVLQPGALLRRRCVFRGEAR
ncbi:MAG TPA: aldose 1-epimerase [Burkholderiaceae bacterium]